MRCWLLKNLNMLKFSKALKPKKKRLLLQPLVTQKVLPNAFTVVLLPKEYARTYFYVSVAHCNELF